MSLSVDHKASNRKSKAPWQLAPAKSKPQSNPYADAGFAAGNDQESAETPRFLGVPSSAQKSRKNTRRLSIHASALASHGPAFDAHGLPPVPSNASMYRTTTNQSDMASVRTYGAGRDRRDDDVVTLIKTELRGRDATAIDDFYKSLLGQKASVENNVKVKIDENQKNILQLTDSLQTTQQQLLSLRVSTKELYGILGEFTDSAERRLELEIAEPAAANTHAGPAANNPLKSKRRDRSSVLVLQKMWAAELQSLYKHVDGAQKHVQAIPDRHILAESGRWHEINVGTWKVSEPVHIFVLNDSVLIATRKRTQDGSAKRLQAAHFWPLSAVELTQITPPTTHAAVDTQTYVVNLRAPSLSYVYQTDRYDHFMRVMGAYQRGKSEIAQKQRMLQEEEERPSQEMGHHRNVSSGSIMEEGADKRQLRDSLRNSGYIDSSKAASPVGDTNAARRSGSHRNSADILLKDISARVHQRNRSHDFMKQEKMSRDAASPAQLFTELKLNEDKLDEVDVHLAHNEYMGAVGLIKHIEARLHSVFERIQNVKKDDTQAEELRLLVDVVKLKINNRKGKVQEGLEFDLTHTIAALTVDQIADIIEFYLTFGKFEEGFRAVLDALSVHLSKIVDNLTSSAHGSTRVDIVNYLSNLIIVHVSIIKRAVNIHRACIVPVLKREGSKTVDSSGFVTWSVSEMERLVALIKKHAAGSLLVESRDEWLIKDVKYYKELRRVMDSQLALLKREGLNVDYLFDDIIHCAPIST
ncbi:hypothetical protein OXX59_004695 [Metschnikowia pulcherrima]